MNKEFIPYEQALELKQLGFDEPCLGYYYTLNGKDWKFADDKQYDLLDEFYNIGSMFTISAPLYQQVFRWFREKYKIEGLILPQNQGAVIDEEPIYFITIISYKNNKMEELFNSTNKETLLHYNPKEEAELACLIKLIEIVKNK